MEDADRFEEQAAAYDPELAACVADLEHSSTKIKGALSSVNIYARTAPLRAGSADDLVTAGDILRRYFENFWNAYEQALQLLHKPTEKEVLATLEALERDCRGESSAAEY